MKKEDFGDILKKTKFKFKNNKELEKYYEDKYRKKGYKKGYTLSGINISNIYHKERLKTAFDVLIPNKKDIILDAGCGDGKLALKIAKKCNKIYAVDISKNAFFTSKKLAPKNLVFLKMNLETLKFKNKFFNKVVCVETLEHVLKPKKVIKEIFRILKPNGKFILTYPTIDEHKLAKFEIKLGLRKPTPVSEHLTEWDYNKIVSEVEKEGFKLIKSKGIVFDLSLFGKLKTLSKRLAKFLTNIQISIKKYPKNSLFVCFVFEKIKN